MKTKPFYTVILWIALGVLLHAQVSIETNQELPSSEEESGSTDIQPPGTTQDIPSLPSSFFEEPTSPPSQSGDTQVIRPTTPPSSDAGLRPPAPSDPSSSILDAERELIERRRLQNELRDEITKELSGREQLKEEILRELKKEMGQDIPTSSTPPMQPPSFRDKGKNLITDTITTPRSQPQPLERRTPPRRDPFRSQVPPQGITLDYVPVGDISYLERAILKIEPKATIIPPEQYEKQPDGSFAVTPRSGQFLPERVYLRASAYWAEPVTAPEAPLTETDACVFRFVEIDGEVLVKSRFNRNEFVHASESLEVPYNAVVITGNRSSTAIILHDRQSLRIGPNAMLRVIQVRNGRILKTRVELVRGAVFCKVGRRRKGGPIDFAVKASQTNSYVKGTDFAVWTRNGQDVVAVATGKVEVQDDNGNHLSMLQNGAQGNLEMMSYPPLGEAKEGEWLMLTLRLTRAMNEKTAHLLDSARTGRKLRKTQESWLARVHRIYWVKPVEVPALFPQEDQLGRFNQPDFPNGEFK